MHPHPSTAPLPASLACASHAAPPRTSAPSAQTWVPACPTVGHGRRLGTVQALTGVRDLSQWPEAQPDCEWCGHVCLAGRKGNSDDANEQACWSWLNMRTLRLQQSEALTDSIALIPAGSDFSELQCTGGSNALQLHSTAITRVPQHRGSITSRMLALKELKLQGRRAQLYLG